MDDHLKDILKKHSWLLVRYINPSDDLIGLLEEGNIIPASMIVDIKESSTKKEKNERILQALKLRGNTAFRSFRDILMRCGQIFIADLLFEEGREGAPLVEESDLTAIPNIKLNLSPEEFKRLTSFLDAKVKYRVLKSDWKHDSTEKMKALQIKCETHKVSQHLTAVNDLKVKQLQEEVASKNDLLRAMSLEINTLNQDINGLLKRHSMSNSTTTIVDKEGDDPEKRSRFTDFEHSLSTSIHRLSRLLGDESTNSGTLNDLDVKTKQVTELVRELEGKLYKASNDKTAAMGLLRYDVTHGDTSAVNAVQSHMEADSQDRMSLLAAIDQLSRIMRNMQKSEPNSGLKALRVSAVTGKPTPDIVDYRFLMNHVKLLEADAAHIAKRLSWKDLEVKALRSEVTTLRRRYGCQDNSPEYSATQVELGD